MTDRSNPRWSNRAGPGTRCRPRTRRGSVLIEFAFGFVTFAMVMISVADFTLEAVQIVETEAAARRAALSYADEGEPQAALAAAMAGSTAFGRLCMEPAVLRVAPGIAGEVPADPLFGDPASISPAAGSVVRASVRCTRPRSPVLAGLMGGSVDRTAFFFARVR